MRRTHTIRCGRATLSQFPAPLLPTIRLQRYRFSIIDASGNYIVDYTDECDTRSYSFRGSDVDFALPFGSLSSGVYTYVLRITETAYDAGGGSYDFTSTLTNTFAVGDAHSTNTVSVKNPSGETYVMSVGGIYSYSSSYDTLSISSYNYPTDITLGSSFKIYGTVTSAESRIREVSVIVRDSSGSAVIHESGLVKWHDIQYIRS